MENVVKAYVAIWNNRSITDLENVFLETATYWDTTQQGNAIEVLKNSIQVTHEMFSGVSFKVLSFSSMGRDRGFLEWLMTGTNPSGKKIEIPGLDRVTMEGEKIAMIKSFYDSSLLAD